MGKLTVLGVKNAKPGRHADGEGLYLLVKPTGAKSWLLRVQVDGKRRDFGLGSATVLKLAEAREAAEALRRQAKSGLDPIAERAKLKRVTPSFKATAIECHRELKEGWRNSKHAAQWLTTLETYAFPHLGEKSVDTIDSPMVRDLLAPIWLTIPETARRVHQRIGTVLDFAHAKGWRQAETPTRSVLKGLPRHRKSDRHFAAMPFVDVPAFMGSLRQSPETIGRLALMFTILTAARSGEVRGARWSEFDLDGALWTVPADRMKAGKVHVVPLSLGALAILGQAKRIGGAAERPVFTSKGTKPLSDMTLTKILRDSDLPFTVHGFRSSFRDWAAEETNFPSEVVEKALAHTIANKVEAAYRRTDFLDRRKKLMRDWSNYIWH